MNKVKICLLLWGVYIMNFNFDDLSQKVTNVFHTAVKKTNKVVESAKISYSISDAENTLNKAFTELGKKIYYSKDALDNIDIEGELEAIDFLVEKVNSEKEKLSAVKCTTNCPACGAKIDKNDDFCKKCGNKLD